MYGCHTNFLTVIHSLLLLTESQQRIMFASLPPALKADISIQQYFSFLLGLAKADSTQAQYQPAWRVFTAWLLRYGISDPFSVDTNIIAMFVTFLISHAENQKIGDGGIKNSMASIRYHFALAGKQAPLDSPYIELLRDTASRILQPNRSRCEPVSAADVHAMLKQFLTPTCDLRTRMHLTVYLLMFLGLFRFDDIQHILVHRDLLRFIYNTDQSLAGVLIFIPCSKTDQSGDGAWVAVGATGGEFCPAKLIFQLLSEGNYVRFSSSMDVGPLLRATKQAYKPSRAVVLRQTTAPLSQPIPALTYSAFRTSILAFAAQCLNKHIGLHSARAGGASAAAEAGIDSRLVCGLGRWKQGTTFADTYIKMMEGNMFRFFEITRQIWPY